MVTDDEGPAFETALARARERFGGIGVDDDAFEAWVRDRLGGGQSLASAATVLCIEDLLLACGCAARDAAALAIFEDELMPAVTEAIRRVAGSDLDEVRQRVRERILLAAPDREAKITKYTGTGPLKGWLRVCAVREALMAQRGRRPSGTLDDHRAMADVMGVDPELELIKHNASEQFRTAFFGALAALSDRDKQLLRDQVLVGSTGEEIARRHHVHPSTVSRWLAKARHALLQGTRRRLGAQLGIGGPELESLMQLISSRLDMSLGAALDP